CGGPQSPPVYPHGGSRLCDGRHFSDGRHPRRGPRWDAAAGHPPGHPPALAHGSNPRRGQLCRAHGRLRRASVDCIIIARPTESAVLFQQMLGRGTRTYPGKTNCLVLDVVGVSTQHTLHTTATLFGCDAGRLARQSVLELLERPAHQDQEDAPLAGTLRSTPVDLFARRALRWVQTRQGAWVLSLGSQHGTLRLRPDGPETWHVVQVRRDAEPVRFGDTLPLPYAQGLAEDYARHLGVMRLVEAEAPWRQQPATEKQTALLRKLGLATRAGLTKGEAADLLAAVLGDWG